MSEPDLNDLAIFVRVIERGSFTAAARELGVPTSTVSRTVARLEARMRVRLLQRTTRSVKPTREGRALHAEIAPAVATLRASSRAIEPSASAPGGRLRISAPSDLTSGFLAGVLADFVAAHPSIEVELSLTNAHASLVDEGFDVAVRATPKLAASSLVARKIGEIEHGLYASPAYLAKRPAPRSIAELPSHALVLFRAEEQERTWQLRERATTTSLRVRGRITGDDFAFVRGMIVLGTGIGLLPRMNAAADEAAGRLVRVLPAVHAKGATLYVLYPSAKNVPARVSAFRDAVREAFVAWTKRG